MPKLQLLVFIFFFLSFDKQNTKTKKHRRQNKRKELRGKGITQQIPTRSPNCQTVSRVNQRAVHLKALDRTKTAQGLRELLGESHRMEIGTESWCRDIRTNSTESVKTIKSSYPKAWAFRKLQLLVG